ncbi:MAG: hypothetical protein U0841_29825 [Chloroflexia bacterium]
MAWARCSAYRARIFVVAILLLPLFALTWRTFESGVFLTSVRKPVVLQALRLTAWTSSFTPVFGRLRHAVAHGPGAGALSGKRLVDMPGLADEVPARRRGVGLLMAFGRRGLLGQRLDAGLPIPFTGSHSLSTSLAFSSAAGAGALLRLGLALRSARRAAVSPASIARSRRPPR